MRVSLFITCICDLFYADVGKATVELLERYGCIVDFPANQTCCGQPAFNSGYYGEAKKVVKHMITTFDDASYVVAPSGSCIGMIKQYKQMFYDDPAWEKKAQDLANRAYELTDFLVNILHVTDVQSTFKGTAVYHPSCHMTRILEVVDPPQTLLKNVQGLQLFPLERREDCCGFGGTFSINYESISTKMVEEKISHIANANVDYVIGADMACLMNIAGCLQRNGHSIEIKHIAEILNEYRERREGNVDKN